MEKLVNIENGKVDGMFCRYEECCTTEDICPNLQLDNCECLKEVLKKLAEYQNAEEQGLILKAPCKIGNTVFRINKGAKNPIIPMVITEIRYKALRSGKVIMKIMCSDDIMTKTDGCSVYYEEEIGEKIFLTREDADKALAEFN